MGGRLQGVRSWHTDQPSVFRVPPPADPTGSTRRNTEPDLLCTLQTAQDSRAWGLPFDASQPWTWPPWKEEDFQRRTFPVSPLRASLAVSIGLESECAQGDAAAAQRSLHRTPLSPEFPRPAIRDQPALLVLSALITPRVYPLRKTLVLTPQKGELGPEPPLKKQQGKATSEGSPARGCPAPRPFPQKLGHMLSLGIRSTRFRGRYVTSRVTWPALRSAPNQAPVWVLQRAHLRGKGVMDTSTPALVLLQRWGELQSGGVQKVPRD